MEINEIEKLAALARIELADGEKQSLLKDVEEILQFVNQVQEVDVDMNAEERVGVPHNVVRDDTEAHTKSIYTEDLLEEAPRGEKGYVRVKKIL